jgi:hypothetical protein
VWRRFGELKIEVAKLTSELALVREFARRTPCRRRSAAAANAARDLTPIAWEGLVTLELRADIE